MRDQVSQPSWDDRVIIRVSQVYSAFNLFANVVFVIVTPRYFNFSTFSNGKLLDNSKKFNIKNKNSDFAARQRRIDLVFR